MLYLPECSRNLGSNPSRASFCYPPSRMDCYAGSLESPSSQLSFACNCGLYLKGDLFLIASNVLSDIVTSTTCRENMANEYERPQLWQKTNERPVIAAYSNSPGAVTGRDKLAGGKGHVHHHECRRGVAEGREAARGSCCEVGLRLGMVHHRREGRGQRHSLVRRVENALRIASSRRLHHVGTHGFNRRAGFVGRDEQQPLGALECVVQGGDVAKVRLPHTNALFRQRLRFGGIADGHGDGGCRNSLREELRHNLGPQNTGCTRNDNHFVCPQLKI